MTNYLKLVWKNENGDSFNVGKLTFKNDKYYFEYNEKEVKRANEYGFEPFPGFPKINVRYLKEKLFKTFEEWIENKSLKNGDRIEFLKNIGNDKFYFMEGDEVS